ncbi:MAG: V-type ATP synthase subunit K [Clostridia bacterium]|nr:V-type ATP synthase subunit K [Clostridia bacterium]
MNWAIVLGYIGIALAGGLAGIGSAIGVSLAGQAAAGVISEDPDKFGKVLLMELLPGTQGIYGLVVAILIMMKMGVFGTGVEMTFVNGFKLFAASLPIGILGLYSGIHQGKAAVAGIHLIGQRGDQSGRALTMCAAVELYAVFGLLISLLAILLGVN